MAGFAGREPSRLRHLVAIPHEEGGFRSRGLAFRGDLCHKQTPHLFRQVGRRIRQSSEQTKKRIKKKPKKSSKVRLLLNSPYNFNIASQHFVLTQSLSFLVSYVF